MLDYRTPLLAIALSAPLMVWAQPDRPRRPDRPGISASELLDARRQLDLSPRQVARLDSIERAEFRRRDSMRQRMTTLRDSVCPGRQRCDLSSEQRQTLRQRMDALRDTRGDSIGRSMAMGLLDSTQRGRVQGWRMSQGRSMQGPRGFGPATRGRGNPPGFRGRGGFEPQRGFGPGMRGRGFGPGMGPGGGGTWNGRGGNGGPGWGPDRPLPPVERQGRRPRRGDDELDTLPDSTR